MSRLPRAAALSRFSQKEQTFLVEGIFKRAHFTTNQLLRLPEWLSDLRKIRKVTLEELLKERSLRQILDHPALDPRLRGEKFFREARRLRFPTVSRLLEADQATGEQFL